MSAFLNVIAHLVVNIFGSVLIIFGLCLTCLLVAILIDDIKERMKRSKPHD